MGGVAVGHRHRGFTAESVVLKGSMKYILPVQCLNQFLKQGIFSFFAGLLGVIENFGVSVGYDNPG